MSDRNTAALALLGGVPLARLIDLAARRDGGNLTNAEALAIGVLQGGRSGEEGLQPLIDAAQEEWGGGTYRVPVRVVADWKRCLLVLTMADGANSVSFRIAHAELVNTHRRMMDGNLGQVVTITSGCKLEVYECSAAEAGVSVVEAPK